MPIRLTPLITGEYYHLLNRGTGGIPIFHQKKDYQKFLTTFLFYQNSSPPIQLAKFLTLPPEERKRLWEKLRNPRERQVEIITYCQIPNHFHFLLKQTKKMGIENFLRWLTNSYSHYFNTKYKRKGSLFGGRFKAIRIETNEQLLHLSRYIHLNSYSSYVIKNLKDLEEYPYSSFPEYIQKRETNFCHKEIILGQFKDPASYKKFVLDQADYQRSLEQIKHQLLE